jgi:hypothetical protein
VRNNLLVVMVLPLCCGYMMVLMVFCGIDGILETFEKRKA